MYKLFFKRFIDVVLTVLIILILSPLYALIALLIFIGDFGNPIFKQKRVGLHEKEFVVFKFRSMPINTVNVASSETSKLKITRMGKFIRRTNIDELPQIFNILFGTMTIVGPRPSLKSQEHLVSLRRENKVYICKPGLTGLTQVNSFDGMSDDQKAEWDGKYASKITFGKDFKIFFQTFVYLSKKPPTY